MAGKKISAQPLVSVVTDAIKMPTGESGDKTISVGQIRSARIASLSIDATATAAGDTVVGSIAISKLYRLLSIVTDQPLRIRLYTTAAARDADLARPSTTEQAQGSSLMLEFVSDAMLLSATKHGMYGDRFYNIYRQIIRRCTEKTHKAYPNYGGKGIQNLWESFEEFKQDMLESYLRHVEMFGEENTTIDRVENTGHYRKTNCRWATWEEQARNKSYPPKTVSIKRNSRKFDCPYCGAGTGVSHKLGCKEIERLESGKRVVKYNRKEVV